jgi:hypothetical protein
MSKKEIPAPFPKKTAGGPASVAITSRRLNPAAGARGIATSLNDRSALSRSSPLTMSPSKLRFASMLPLISKLELPGNEPTFTSIDFEGWGTVTVNVVALAIGTCASNP